MPVCYVGFAEGFAAAQPMLRIVHMSFCAIGSVYYFSQEYIERTVRTFCSVLFSSRMDINIIKYPTITCMSHRKAMWYSFVEYLSIPHGLPYKDGKCKPQTSMYDRPMTEQTLQLSTSSNSEVLSCSVCSGIGLSYINTTAKHFTV